MAESVSAAQRHMDAMAALGCILCILLKLGRTPAECHHPREEQGGAQRADDLLVIPLCPEHHRGPSGFHGLGKQAFIARYGVDELDLLAMALALLLYGQRPKLPQSRNVRPSKILPRRGV